MAVDGLLDVFSMVVLGKVLELVGTGTNCIQAEACWRRSTSLQTTDKSGYHSGHKQTKEPLKALSHQRNLFELNTEVRAAESHHSRDRMVLVISA